MTENKINILHTADWHWHKKFLKECRRPALQLYNYIQERKIDLLLIAGDIMDTETILASSPFSPINAVISYIRDLADLVPIIMIEGNPPHDLVGSLDVFQNLQTRYPIKVIKKCDNNFIAFNISDKSFCEFDIDIPAKDFLDEVSTDELVVIHSLPWPMKSRFLDNEELQLNLKEVNNLYVERFNLWIGKRKSFYKIFHKKFPIVLLGHLQLEGSRVSTGQEMQSQFHKVDMLKNICHYGALGHIHLEQSLGDKNELHYSGSWRNKNWGEREKKCFKHIQFLNDNHTIENKVKKVYFDIPLLTKLLIKGKEEYENIESILDKNLDKNSENEVWLSIKDVKSRTLVNEDKLKRILKKYNGNLSKLTVQETIKTSHRVEQNNLPNKKLKDIEAKYIYWCKEHSLPYNRFQLNVLQEAGERI